MKNRFARANAQYSSQPSTSHGTQSVMSTSSTKVKDYFDDDDEDEVPSSNVNSSYDDPDYDPLDAYMSGIQEQIVKDNSTKTAPLPEIVSKYDSDDENYNSRAPTHSGDISSDIVDLDDYDKNNMKSKPIEPLAAVDHSKMKYASFTKKFYKECSELAALSADEVSAYREELEIHVPLYRDIVKPLKTFKHAGFEAQLLKEIEKAGYTAPTAIQAQTIPLALSGCDVIGLAKTGSGKTLAYIWPIIVHIMHQPQMQLGDGPIALVLAPTRELASQIYAESKKYLNIYQIRATVIYGGAGKFEMMQSLKESPELVIATPGRLIEMIKNKSTNLARCTIAVLDEADRMFEMGFEYQMRSIMQNIRPNDRQILMFSATMKKKIEGFAREILNNESVRVVIGSIGQANPDIQQIVHILPSEQLKYQWLTSNIEEFVAEGKVLIFVLNKVNTEELSKNLREYFVSRYLSVNVDCLHGDRDQSERSLVMSRFKQSTIYKDSTQTSSTNEISILIATDIAARGLDVKDIRTVINYDIAKNIDTYVHRIGRTGRMGQEGVTPGTAYTLLTAKDSNFAVDLVHNLTLSKQPVTAELRSLAERDPKWKRHHNSNSWNNNSSSAGGIGFVGASGGLSNPSVYGGKVAMTSSMAAQNSQQLGVGHDVQFSAGIMKAYDKSFTGEQPLGRGKHLTQPSWMQNINTAVSANKEATSSGNETEPVKKKSRFSEAILPGFVKSSQTILGTVSVEPKQVTPAVKAPSVIEKSNEAEQPRVRKSRWDS